MDDRNIAPAIGKCDDFIAPHHPQPTTTTVVITMNKCVHDQERGVPRDRFIYGCNKGDGCMNPECWFGCIMRDKKRAEAKARRENE